MDVEQGLGDAAYENNSPSFVESLYHVEEEKSVEFRKRYVAKTK